MRASIFAAAIVLAAPSASAEVTEQGDSGFATRNVATTKASPKQAYAALGKPGLWWNGDHTYSGNAKNLTLALAPGGCFCETVPADGSKIEHARVVYLKPDAILRWSGALGPLQAEGVTGSLTWEIKPLPGGGSEIVQTYVVGGLIRGGVKYAAIVDKVVGEQLTRLKAYLDGAK